MKPETTVILVAFLLISPTLSFTLLPHNPSNNKTTNQSHPHHHHHHHHSREKGGGGTHAGSSGPGDWFNIPGFGMVKGGGSYGVGYGGPSGGHRKRWIIRPTVECTENGPCYKKKLRCPAKCFTSFSRSGKGGSYGGGGGGCTMDCVKTCTAYC